MHGIETINRINGKRDPVKPGCCGPCKFLGVDVDKLPCNDCWNENRFISRFTKLDKCIIVGLYPLHFVLNFIKRY